MSDEVERVIDDEDVSADDLTIEDFRDLNLVSEDGAGCTIEEDLIEDALERQRARDMYREAKAREEPDGGVNIVEGLKTVFIPNPSYPTTATVDRVRTEGDDEIVISTSLDKSDDNLQENRGLSFHLDEDLHRLDQLLGVVGVSNPADLEGEEVPVHGSLNDSYGNRQTYELRIPENNHGLLAAYYVLRLFDRTHSWSVRKDSTGLVSPEYKYELNRNGVLLVGLLLGFLAAPLFVAGNLTGLFPLVLVSGVIGIIAGVAGGFGILGYLMNAAVLLYGFLFTSD